MRRRIFLQIVKITTPLNVIPKRQTNISVLTKIVFQFPRSPSSIFPRYCLEVYDLGKLTLDFCCGGSFYYRYFSYLSVSVSTNMKVSQAISVNVFFLCMFGFCFVCWSRGFHLSARYRLHLKIWPPNWQVENQLIQTVSSRIRNLGAFHLFFTTVMTTYHWQIPW